MDIFSRIVTRPQKAELKKAPSCLLGKAGVCLCTVENKLTFPLAKAAEARIRERIFELTDSTAEGKDTVIKLKLKKAPEGIANPSQGYELTVKEGEITLSGFGELGLFYAATTLIQLLKLENGELSLPAMKILDYPSIEKRGHFIESRYGTNTMTLSDWKAIVDDMVEKKQNDLSISVYGCWSIQYDGEVSEYIYYPFAKYPKLKTPVHTRYWSPLENKWIDNVSLPPMFEENFFKDIIAYGKERGVYVYPFMNTYGHNTLVPAQYPETSAKFRDGTPTTNGYCTSDPATYELLFNMFDDLIENCLAPNGITSINIGLDEVGDDDYTIGVNAKTPFKELPAFCHCPECEKGGKRPIDKFIAHAVKLAKYLKSRGMTEVYMFSDMIYRKNRPPEQNYIKMFYDALRENDLLDTVVLDFWTYPDLESKFGFEREIIRDLPGRFTLKPMNGYYHWNIVRQSVKNSYIMAEYARESKPLGYLSYSGVDRSFDRTNSLQATLSWNLGAPDDISSCTRLYCERLFPSDVEKAVRAFTLLDLMNDDTDKKDENGKDVLCTRTLMEKWLAYYFYSYLRRNIEYPQNFPGRAVKNILSDRENAEKLMLLVHSYAKEGEEIFEALSQCPENDRKTAKRLAVECAHYRVLVEEYFAILRMYDLTRKKLCDCAVSEIKTLSLKCEKARLTLMSRVMEEKEEYLFSSQLRNMSIFLQFFRDLSAYLAATPAEKVKLDFTDLSDIASEQFKKLR